MASAQPGAEPCAHVRGYDIPYPFSLSLVLDDHGGVTDAVAACLECDAHYLIELIDWRGKALAERLYRVSLLDDAIARAFVRDMTRGSCDVARAGAEMRSIQATARLTRYLLWLDVGTARQRGLIELADDADIATAPWRERLTGRPADAAGVYFARTSVLME